MPTLESWMMLYLNLEMHEHPWIWHGQALFENNDVPLTQMDNWHILVVFLLAGMRNKKADRARA